MFYYLIKLSYNGSAYCGWQSQGRDDKLSVQEALEATLSSFVHHQKVHLYGASRTDTGVHALGQFVKVELPKEIENAKLVMGLNSKLPADIKALSCQRVEKAFNFNSTVCEKEYHYYLSDQNPALGPFYNSLYFHPIKLDFPMMKKAALKLIGEHDFSNLHVQGSRPSSPIRTINECFLEEVSWPGIEQCFVLKIKSSGFLKYMVRMIMQLLIDLGEGKVSEAEFDKILNAEFSAYKLKKAPAQGLYLKEITLKL